MVFPVTEAESPALDVYNEPVSFRRLSHMIEDVVGDYNVANNIIDVTKRYLLSGLLSLKPIVIGNLTFIMSEDGSIKVKVTPEYKNALSSEENRDTYLESFYKNKVASIINEDFSKVDDSKISDMGLAMELTSWTSPVIARHVAFKLVEFFELAILNSYIDDNIIKIYSEEGKVLVEYKEAKLFKSMASEGLRSKAISSLYKDDSHISKSEMKRLWTFWWEKGN